MSRPSRCTVCGDSRLKSDSYGFLSCLSCGTQQDYVQQINEFNQTNVAGTGRGTRTVKRINKNKLKDKNKYDPKQIAINDSKLILITFNLLLHRICDNIITKYNVNNKLNEITGKIWLQYLKYWRTNGWGDNQYKLLLNVRGPAMHFLSATLHGFKIRKFNKKYENKLNETNNNDNNNIIFNLTDDIIDSEQKDEEIMESKENNNNTNSSNSKNSKPPVLRIGEVCMPLALAIVYIALQILRESITLSNLIRFGEYGEIPYRNIISSQYLPPRLLQTISSKFAIVQFFSPKTLPTPIYSLGLANFVSMSINLPQLFPTLNENPKRKGKPSGRIKINAPEAGIGYLYRIFPLSSELFNSRGVLIAMANELQIPASILPLCLELLRVIQFQLKIDIDDRTLVSLIVLVLKLVYGLDERCDQLLMNQLHPEYDPNNVKPILPNTTNTNRKTEPDENKLEQLTQFKLDHNNLLVNIVQETIQSSNVNKFTNMEDDGQESNKDIDSEAIGNPSLSIRPSIFELRNKLPDSVSSVRSLAPEYQTQFIQFLNDQALFNMSLPSDFDIYTEALQVAASASNTDNREKWNKTIINAPTQFFTRLAPCIDQIFDSNIQFPYERLTYYARLQNGYLHHSYNYVLLLCSLITAIPVDTIHSGVGHLIALLWKNLPRLKLFPKTRKRLWGRSNAPQQRNTKKLKSENSNNKINTNRNNESSDEEMVDTLLEAENEAKEAKQEKESQEEEEEENPSEEDNPSDKEEKERREFAQFLQENAEENSSEELTENESESESGASTYEIRVRE